MMIAGNAHEYIDTNVTIETDHASTSESRGSKRSKKGKNAMNITTPDLIDNMISQEPQLGCKNIELINSVLKTILAVCSVAHPQILCTLCCDWRFIRCTKFVATIPHSWLLELMDDSQSCYLVLFSSI
ncbi:uncharacterized protein LOC130803014 [Amaranthus tricolor]|uniref:uncharacterized protein LOC130803014 n=1 Tax=Amaranthus tricolor TaxID=29722 RepID=UPI002586F4DC|nr:uncharacterized protein LOC130803014 [Amaranthus tricolor]